jgi:hypothetical protein
MICWLSATPHVLLDVLFGLVPTIGVTESALRAIGAFVEDGVITTVTIRHRLSNLEEVHAPCQGQYAPGMVHGREEVSRARF